MGTVDPVQGMLAIPIENRERRMKSCMNRFPISQFFFSLYRMMKCVIIIAHTSFKNRSEWTECERLCVRRKMMKKNTLHTVSFFFHILSWLVCSSIVCICFISSCGIVVHYCLAHACVCFCFCCFCCCCCCCSYIILLCRHNPERQTTRK